MAQEDAVGTAQLGALLAAYSAFVTYVPLRTEVPFRDFFPIPADKTVYEIPPRAALDPFTEAKNALEEVGSEKACIFLPGRRFDAAGTRFGQGGGWYDRFLSAVPSSWLRVGFCYRRQFSVDPLKREDWDQVMDFVCVADEKRAAVSVHETRAR